MKLIELKTILNEFPPDCDELEVVFGDTVTGEPIERVERYGDTIEMSYF